MLLPSRNYTLGGGPDLRASLESVLPWVVAAAVALPRYSWDILVGDTQCNSTIGPLTAVDMVYKYKPHMFLGSLRRQLTDNNEYKMLGPVCPDVLSPVSRFSTIWGTPVFTTSGMSAAFRDKSSEYKYLTCMAGDYSQLGHFVNQLLGTELSQINSLIIPFHSCCLQTSTGGSTSASCMTSRAPPAPPPCTRCGP